MQESCRSDKEVCNSMGLVKENVKTCVFYGDNGEEIGRLEDVKEITIDHENEEREDLKNRFINNKEINLSFEPDKKSIKNLNKLFYSKGIRNGRILKRDGYLNPENCDKE